MTPLRQRIRARTTVVGTFVKTPSPHVVEILGRAGIDFAVIDAEHAPFDLADTDRLVLAARSVRLPCLVRVPAEAAHYTAACLDLGADGILFPHVRDAARARAAAGAVKFSHRRRGFSPSPRAADYGLLEPTAYRADADRRSMVWCQIEDVEALNDLDAIAQTEAVDCLFIGRMDLAASMGLESAVDPQVGEAVRVIAAAARKHDVAAGIHVADTAEIGPLAALGISVFICGSDQSLLMRQAQQLRAGIPAHASAS